MKNLIKQIIKETIDEALRDELPDYMINAVKKNNPSLAGKFLDMDVPKHTELIPNVKIEIDEPNIRNKFIKEIQNYFKKSILEQFQKTKLFENFMKKNVIAKILSQGLNYEMPVRDSHFFFEIFYNIRNFNIFADENKRFMDKLKFFYSKEFPLLQGKDNSLIRPIFSKNKSNLFSFIKSFNTAFPQHTIDLNEIMNDRVFQGLREPIMNFDENVNDLANTKLYLYITDKPADVLRMSVSNFYSSCQNMYSGSHNDKLLANVFDENSKISYLLFETPYIDNQGNKHPFTPIARTIIRVGENNKIMFDKTYPLNMQQDFYNILQKYTELRNQGKIGDIYPYKPTDLPAPYMDMYNMKTISKTNTAELKLKIKTLASVLNVSTDKIRIFDDTTFIYNEGIYGDIEDYYYHVYTEAEANEWTLDVIRDNWLEDEEINEMNFKDMVEKYKIIDIQYVYDALVNYIPDYDDDEHSSTPFEDILKNADIETFNDFRRFLLNSGQRDNWFVEGQSFNLNNLIKYLGGIDKARQDYLKDLDNEKEIHINGFYIYRTY